MRKFVLAGVALFFTVGLVLAAEVTFLKYDKDKKELTVRDKDDKEATYKVTSDTKFMFKGKDGSGKDIPNDKGIERLEKMEDGGKAKGKAKLEIEVDKSKKEVKEITFRGGGKKK